MTRRVSVKLGPSGTGELTMDGQDISGAVNALTVRSRVGQLSHVELSLPGVHIDFDGEAAVELKPAVAELLVRLGWTPPDGAS